jgi:hypothetical protein
MTLRIAMWSGPRNISTAMMRSFSSRADCAVSDEPFYGCYLKASGADHPMREAVIASMDCDWQSVADTLSGPVPSGRPVWYQKHMPHHMTGPIAPDDLQRVTHAFLIRDPARMAALMRPSERRSRPRISAPPRSAPSSSARPTGSARRRLWWIPPMSCAIPQARWRCCARRWGSHGTKRCCHGAPGAIRRTVSGPTIGTPGLRRRPASAQRNQGRRP